MRLLSPVTGKNAQSFLTKLKPTGKTKRRRNKTLPTPIMPFKLYNQAHPDRKMTLPKEPKSSDFYQPSAAQKEGELRFVGGGALALGYAAFRFL